MRLIERLRAGFGTPQKASLSVRYAARYRLKAVTPVSGSSRLNRTLEVGWPVARRISKWGSSAANNSPRRPLAGVSPR